MLDLFDDARLDMAPGAVLLRGYVASQDLTLRAELQEVVRLAPFRHMHTPRGQRMSVGMTNCGALGWVSDAQGYRYSATDPQTGGPWPAMPPLFAAYARMAAAEAGFGHFEPDACLVNCYAPGTQLSLHQDRDERDFSQPIVSVSLGLAAKFFFGGAARSDPVKAVALAHGDVVVWGGVARKNFHAVGTLAKGSHPFWGDHRINLTFRKAN